jgi:hypothetical protein
MVKTVMNRARPMITELGGTCWVPMAVRKREKTIIIRKKEVTEIKKKGTREIREIARISWILLENCGEAMMLCKLRFGVKGVWAYALGKRQKRNSNRSDSFLFILDN